jgi:hypothetical protein
MEEEETLLSLTSLFNSAENASVAAVKGLAQNIYKRIDLSEQIFIL